MFYPPGNSEQKKVPTQPRMRAWEQVLRFLPWTNKMKILPVKNKKADSKKIYHCLKIIWDIGIEIREWNWINSCLRQSAIPSLLIPAENQNWDLNINTDKSVHHSLKPIPIAVAREPEMFFYYYYYHYELQN